MKKNIVRYIILFNIAGVVIFGGVMLYNKFSVQSEAYKNLREQMSNSIIPQSQYNKMITCYSSDCDFIQDLIHAERPAYSGSVKNKSDEGFLSVMNTLMGYVADFSKLHTAAENGDEQASIELLRKSKSEYIQKIKSSLFTPASQEFDILNKHMHNDDNRYSYVATILNIALNAYTLCSEEVNNAYSDVSNIETCFLTTGFNIANWDVVDGEINSTNRNKPLSYWKISDDILLAEINLELYGIVTFYIVNTDDGWKIDIVESARPELYFAGMYRSDLSEPFVESLLEWKVIKRVVTKFDDHQSRLTAIKKLDVEAMDNTAAQLYYKVIYVDLDTKRYMDRCVSGFYEDVDDISCFDVEADGGYVTNTKIEVVDSERSIKKSIVTLDDIRYKACDILTDNVVRINKENAGISNKFNALGPFFDDDTNALMKISPQTFDILLQKITTNGEYDTCSVTPMFARGHSSAAPGMVTISNNDKSIGTMFDIVRKDNDDDDMWYIDVISPIHPKIIELRKDMWVKYHKNKDQSLINNLFNQKNKEQSLINSLFNQKNKEQVWQQMKVDINQYIDDSIEI